jgi:hypothetical protein
VDFVVSTSPIEEPAVHSVQMRKKGPREKHRVLHLPHGTTPWPTAFSMRKTLEDFNMVDIVKI